MTVETVRQICMSFPGVTEDIKWGRDLVFSVGQKMFAAMDTEPPYSLGFKCSPEAFCELVERDGIVPAPYLARAMWVLEQELGHALERPELETLLRSAYDIVVAKLPASRRPGMAASSTAPKKRRAQTRVRRKTQRRTLRADSRKKRTAKKKR